MTQLLLVATLTGLSTVVGVLPLLLADGLPRRTYDALLGLGAGLMLAAATLALLPGALYGGAQRTTAEASLGRTLIVLGAFATGALLLWLMDHLIPHQHAGGHHGHVGGDPSHDDSHDHCHHATIDERARHQGLLVLGAMSLHRLPEGFALGAGFAAGGARPLGMVLALAIGVQNAVEGAVMAAPLRRGGLSSFKLLALVSASGMVVPLAALVGYTMADRIAGALPLVLALAAGALISLACNEVIPESHSHGNERRATLGLLTGFAIIIVLQSIFGVD